MSDSTGTATGLGGLGGPDDDDDLDAVEAVPAGRLAGAGSGPVRGGSARAGVATKERRPARVRNIGTFYRQVVAELRKVIWPNRNELVTYTTVVLFFVVIMVLIVSIFDFAFGQAVLKVFGE